MASSIFINYRGSDSRGYGALLFAELSRRFGRDTVFFASESIPAGADSADRLLYAAQHCLLLFAIIGQQWLTTTDPDGRRRIDDPHDWVRRELVEASAAGATVIPILTDDAQLPTEMDLPDDISWLARMQYRRLRYREVMADVERICSDIARMGAISECGAGAPYASEVPGAVPAQLPRDVFGFVGRANHISRLDTLLGTARSQRSGLVISTITGAAGVGKTALAVHWAHRVANQFPDGQLYMDLRGFDSAGQVMPATDAVRGFLVALGVPTDRVPASSQAQAALYRSCLAGKRILIVLDNARSAEHVRPLFPGTSSTFVVVTSRDQLTPLSATDAAHSIDLDVLSGTESRQLLARRLGEDRLAAEPGAVEEIICRCARLPLALSIAAARARHSDYPLITIAEKLNKLSGKLAAFDAGDSTSKLQTVFSWSYAALTEAAARLFRLLGLHPGPEMSAAAAVALSGTTLTEVNTALGELANANLISEHRPSRYAFHDLLRAYAAELAGRLDSRECRRTAVGRMLNYYAYTTCSAAQQLEPHRDRIPLPPTSPSPELSPSIASEREATDWFTNEYLVIEAILDPAEAYEFHAEIWQLSWALDTFLTRRSCRRDLAVVWRTALRAAERIGNPSIQGHAHRSLALAYTLSGCYVEANSHYERALDLFAGAGDDLGQAHTHRHLAYLMERGGRPDLAFGHAEKSRQLYLETDHHRGQARALNNVGWYHALLGRYSAALKCCRQALVQLAQLGDRWGQAGTWDSIGYASHRIGDQQSALYCYTQAVAIFRELGNRYDEAVTLARVADVYQTQGQVADAQSTLQAALNILIELAHPEARAVQTRIENLMLGSVKTQQHFVITTVDSSEQE